MIDLLSPLTLLLILPIAGAIIALYLLKLKRLPHITSSTMLWTAAIADMQANVPLQRLRKNLLLFLQLLIVIIALLAASKPYLNVADNRGQRAIVVIDTSLSMQSTDVKPTRFGAAKQEVLQMINGRRSGENMLVIAAGSRAQVLAPFDTDKQALSKIVESLKPTDAGCDMQQALMLAGSLTAESSGPVKIVVLSDGGFGALSDIPLTNAELDFRCIGKSSENVAITGISSRKSLSGSTQIFVGIRNYSSKQQDFNLELYAGDRLVDVRRISCGAGESITQIFENPALMKGRVTAKLDMQDELQADNVGYVYAQMPKELSVLLVSQGNLFLQNALNLDKYVRLDKTDTLPSGFASAAYDIIVFDGITPPDKLPAGGYLLVNTHAKQGPASVGEEIKNPAVVDFDRNHPASKYVDFSGLRIAAGHRLFPQHWAQVLAEETAGALCVAGEHSGRRFVQLGWNLLDSDFPLRAGFPIFIANCIDYLASSASSEGSFSIRAGQTAQINIPAGAQSVTVRDPNGTVFTPDAITSPLIFDRTEVAGVYTYSSGKLKGEFAVNAASERESDTAPVNEITLGESKHAASRPSAARTRTEFYRPLLLAVLLILSLEWYIHHRRI